MRLTTVLAFIGLVFSDAAYALDITTCGQTVPPGQVGILMADLDCGPADVPDSVGINVKPLGRVELNGHTLQGAERAIECGDVCQVYGPGTIHNAGTAIWINNFYFSRPKLSRVANLTLRENGLGLASLRTDVSDVVLIDNVDGIAGGRVSGENVTMSGCQVTCLNIAGKSTTMRGLTISASPSSHALVYIGFNSKVVLRDTVISGNNAAAGIQSQSKVRLVGSTVDGNGVDIISAGPPKLARTVCGTSRHWNEVDSWGVCAND
jgi:hypothetical protein